MNSHEADPGHTKFYCATSPKDGKPFAMRFDPAIFSDEVIKTMLRTQVNYVLRGNGFVKIALSDSKGKPKEINITPLSLLKRDKTKNLIEELLSEVRKADIVKGVIIRNESLAKKFIEEEMGDEITANPRASQKPRQSAFETFINELSSVDEL